MADRARRRSVGRIPVFRRVLGRRRPVAPSGGSARKQPENSQVTARKDREQASGEPEDHQTRVGSARNPPEPPSLNDRILALLRRQPTASRREIAAALGTTRSTVRYRLDKLRAAGKIDRPEAFGPPSASSLSRPGRRPRLCLPCGDLAQSAPGGGWHAVPEVSRAHRRQLAPDSHRTTDTRRTRCRGLPGIEGVGCEHPRCRAHPPRYRTLTCSW